ncbi:MAG: hypothetical protein K0R29_1282 [Pseudobdellovibrio sp.]|nr:hypothetical protein [Pseudobdellovibrio sp.]
MKLIKTLQLFIVLFFLAGCSINLFREMADKNTDEALLYDAQKAVNNRDYDTAIDIINNQLGGSARVTTEAREILASAYAGKCGLNFLEFVDGLANATAGTAFQLASSPFVGTAVDSAYCLQSLQTIDLIGTNAERTVDQNAFAAVVGMVLMGSATRLYTDNTPVDGDGTPDAPDISCSLTDNQVDLVVLGYGYMSSNFSALGSQLGDSSGDTFSDSIAACESVAGSACQITDQSDITPQIRDTMRDLLNTQQYGVGSFDASSNLLIPAACP